MAVKHLERALAAGATLALAAATVAVAGAASKPKPPSGWVGTVKYDYTIVETGLGSRQATETASVTFKRTKSRPAGYYEVKVGTITWQASAEEPDIGCRYSGSGSLAVKKNDVNFNLNGRAPYKAFFSSPADLQVRVLRTCGTETSTDDEMILHPFLLLIRKTAGVAVAKNLKTIKGSSPGSTTSASGSEQWTYNWSFKAVR